MAGSISPTFHIQPQFKRPNLVTSIKWSGLLAASILPFVSLPSSSVPPIDRSRLVDRSRVQSLCSVRRSFGLVNFDLSNAHCTARLPRCDSSVSCQCEKSAQSGLDKWSVTVVAAYSRSSELIFAPTPLGYRPVLEVSKECLQKNHPWLVKSRGRAA